ncbi:MAG: hypothetical protein ACOC9R_01060 [bacterium]
MTREQVARRAGLALAIGTGTLLVAGATLFGSFVAVHPGAFPVHLVVPVFYNVPLALAFGVVSAVVVNWRPDHPVGWLLGVLGLTVAVSHFTEGYVAWGLPGETALLWINTVQRGPIFFCLAMTMLLFPTGRPASRAWRWLGRLLWAYLAAALLVTATAPWPWHDEFIVVFVKESRGEWPPESSFGWYDQPWLADASTLVVPVGLVLMLAALLSLLPRWRRAVGDERQQLKWLGLAALLAGLELVVGLTQTIAGQMPEDDPLGELVGTAIFTLVIAGIPVAIGLGIVRYRLYDIDVVINKTVVYGGLALFISLAYVVGVVAAGELVGRWAGSSTLLALAVTAAVATAFQPLRRRLQAAADRWVFGERAAPYELMTRFARDLGQAIAPEDLLAHIAETAGQAARARAAKVTATLPSGQLLSASWPAGTTPDPPAAVVPVHDDGEPIAEITVAGDGVRTADLTLLRHTAAASAGALRNLRLLAELESLRATIDQQNQQIAASRQRLVAAADDERQRLARFVAQRLGPDLDILRETLPTLEAATGTDPEAVAAGCQRLAAHAGQLVDEIRALSRGVLPPLLTDHGLAPALRALLRRLDLNATLTIEPSAADRFPPHIETTVYLCCRAVLQAGGGRDPSTATVRLRRDAGTLAFTISRDQSEPHGDELAIAHDRITTLGGHLTTTPEGGRSSVSGHVPLGAEGGSA